jgi:hypothetical protein
MSAMSYTGTAASYGAGGFYQLLGHTRAESDMIIDHLTVSSAWRGA